MVSFSIFLSLGSVQKVYKGKKPSRRERNKDASSEHAQRNSIGRVAY